MLMGGSEGSIPGVRVEPNERELALKVIDEAMGGQSGRWPVRASRKEEEMSCGVWLGLLLHQEDVILQQDRRVNKE